MLKLTMLFVLNLFFSVLLNNPTMNSDGTFKIRFGEEWDALHSYMQCLMGEMQRRGDFVVLACETVVGEVCKRTFTRKMAIS